MLKLFTASLRALVQHLLPLFVATFVIAAGSGATKAQCPGTNYALSFDGIDDVVNFGSGPTLPGASHTIECWIRAASAGGVVVGKDHHDAAGDCHQGFLLSPTSYIVDRAGCANHDEITTLLVAGVWQHFAGTFDGTTMRLYVNGEEVGSRTAVLSAGSRFAAGATWSFFFNRFKSFFHGDLDEVRLWSVVRTSTQIQESMNVVLTGTETGLIGYWRFDEGSGQAANPTGVGNLGVFGNSSLPDVQDPAWIASTAPLSGVAVVRQPISSAICPSGTATFSINAAGFSPRTYQWQWQQIGAPGVWTDLVEGPNADSGSIVRFTATGATEPTVAVFRDNHLQGALDVIQALRCVVTNSCGSVTSEAATLTVVTTGDMNCDCVVNGLDIAPFVQAVLDPSAFATAHPGCDILHGDIDANNTVELLDISGFVNCALTGICP